MLNSNNIIHAEEVDELMKEDDCFEKSLNGELVDNPDRSKTSTMHEDFLSKKEREEFDQYNI